MKTLVSALLLALISLGTARADLVYQETIKSNGRLNGNYFVGIKGSKIRIDLPDEKVGGKTILFDAKSGELIYLYHERKEIQKTTFTEVQKVVREQNPELFDKIRVTDGAVATGQKEKIGEVETEIYRLGNTRFWVAKTFPNQKSINSQISAAFSAFPNPMTDPKFLLDGMVVQTVFDNPDKTLHSEGTLVKATMDSPDAKLFVPPADYKEVPFGPVAEK